MADKFHIDEDCQTITGEHDDEVFYNCLFRDLNGLTLRNCDLNQSRFLTEDVKQMLTFTVTLNCHSFADVELSATIFDYLLLLLVRTKGNTEKRKQLIEILGGKKRVIEMLRMVQDLEVE